MQPDHGRSGAAARVAVDGKFFSLGGRRFRFSGVSYGTFKPRDDGARYPERDRVKRDFIDIADSGFPVERTHIHPPGHVDGLAADLRSYLSHLHTVAGDLPVVLGETGLDAGPGPAGCDGEAAQAAALDWQVETALERGLAGTCVFSWTDEWWVGDAAVEGWHFGLTRADRSPRPALEVAERWNDRTVRDVLDVWPSISVVICAYNAAATLDECLDHTCRLDY